jgi:Protein of unknown function (DUF2934)
MTFARLQVKEQKRRRQRDRRIGGRMYSTQSHISDDDIARRAYEIWQSRGCPASDGQEDWETAKAELTGTRIGRNGSTQQRAQNWWQRVRQKMSGQP